MKKWILLLALLFALVSLTAGIWVYSKGNIGSKTSTGVESRNIEKETGVTDSGKDGISSVICKNTFRAGPTTVVQADLNSVEPLPAVCVPYNNLVYIVKTEAIVSGPHIVTFSLPSVDDPTVFANLKIFHLEEHTVDPARDIWADCTIPASEAAHDFSARTIKARAWNLGKFAIASVDLSKAPDVPVADLEVTSVSTPNPVVVGNNLTYSIVVKNNGPQTVNDLVLSNTASPYTDRISVTSAQGNCRRSKQDSNGAICNLESLAPGENWGITIVVSVRDMKAIFPEKKSVEIENETSLVGKARDPNYANNKVKISTTLLLSAK